MLLSPFTLLISLMVDLISLPALLLKEESHFEYKYQTQLESFTIHQEHMVINLFIDIIYGDFKNRAVKSLDLLEFLDFHREIFKICPNLHDFYCRGAKNHVTALANVGNFNTAKILGT